MLECAAQNTWLDFLEFIKKRCSSAEYENWFKPITLISFTEDLVTLEVPNVFVREYLLDNYRQDFCDFLPQKSPGEPSIAFVIASTQQAPALSPTPVTPP
ncbi:MAG: chromosomal replication initiator protein DnaA, partial [Chlamydiae bacterium]|nr:chromosomal replication initiator protein DnaA [Chlamydiota bacterium]